MPGPGGGGHGGGFHGGGSFGGSSGGGFHGGGFRGPRGPRPMGGFWFFGPRFYGGYGGGCLGWLFGPIIMLAVMGIVMVFLIFSLIGNIGQHQIDYDNESAAQEYAVQQYSEAFRDESAYEDKILIVFLRNEDNTDYYTNAWVGDDLTTRVIDLFGNEYTAFGRSMIRRFGNGNTNYTYSFATGIRAVLEDMADEIGSSPFLPSCKDETHVEKPSRLISRVDEGALVYTPETVDEALAAFTEATGIEIVIVVDEAAEVLGYVSATPAIIALVVMALVMGLIIFSIVRTAQARKKNGTSDGGSRNTNSQDETFGNNGGDGSGNDGGWTDQW